jgi:WD40 repeat protein
VEESLLRIIQAEQSTKVLSHPSQVWSVSYSPDGKTLASADGKTLASASADNTVKLWDVGTGKELETLNGHQDQVISVSYSPDGKTLASASYDKTVKLWDVVTGKELKTLNGHKSLVNSVSYSPDGKTLASASGDKTIILWNFDLDQLMQEGCTWIGVYLSSHPEQTELQQICQPYLPGKSNPKP